MMGWRYCQQLSCLLTGALQDHITTVLELLTPSAQSNYKLQHIQSELSSLALEKLCTKKKFCPW